MSNNIVVIGILVLGVILSILIDLPIRKYVHTVHDKFAWIFTYERSLQSAVFGFITLVVMIVLFSIAIMLNLIK